MKWWHWYAAGAVGLVAWEVFLADWNYGLAVSFGLTTGPFPAALVDGVLAPIALPYLIYNKLHYQAGVV